VVKPRSEKLNLMPLCGVSCHNGVGPQFTPQAAQGQEAGAHPDHGGNGARPGKNLQHGRGRIWCLDCHHTTQRNKLVDHFGDPVSFDQPQLLCGKCHGDKLRDWRDGIHGKRIGDSPAPARSAGSPAPSATTRTTCRTVRATRASCSCSRRRRRTDLVSVVESLGF
jgi:hypothetical protein